MQGKNEISDFNKGRFSQLGSIEVGLNLAVTKIICLWLFY